MTPATDVEPAAAQHFRALQGHGPSTVWSAPGRVNLIGEHVDYHGGLVLPLAVPLRVQVAAAPRDDGRLVMRSVQQPGQEVAVDVADIGPGSVEGWSAYVAGVAWALREHGTDVRGATLVVDGQVPAGSGLSSSAALECATAGALLDLAGAELDPLTVARLAQRAENEVVGMPCGLMDQAASMLARSDHALELDCHSLETRQVPLPLAAHGLALVVTDTRAPHRLVDGEYAARRRDGERAAALLGATSLREVGPDELGAALAVLPGELRPRLRHVVTEIARVQAAVAALDADDVDGLGPLLDASHASLRDDYEVSCPELDVAAAAARSAGALGARMTGGGFGGSTVALVPVGDVPAVVAAVTAAFEARGWPPPVSRVVEPVDGAHRLDVG